MKHSRDFSSIQEKHIAKAIKGKPTPNSGGTKFGGGDVLTDKFFIEAKTTMKEKTSFSIKKEWIKKMQEQMFEQGKEYCSLAFQFEPNGENYYIINERMFIELKEMLENE